MVHILHTLAANGYHLVACTDMSKRGPDKDTLIFRPGPPAQRWFFAVSFNEFDKIRLIDSPNDEVTRAFAAAVRVSEGGQAGSHRPNDLFWMSLAADDDGDGEDGTDDDHGDDSGGDDADLDKTVIGSNPR